MKKIIAIALMGLGIGSLQAQNKVAQDREAILAMKGCYKVEFRYAEIFSPDTGYHYPEREYLWSYEWVVPITVEDNFVSLQHLLTVDDTTVVKHWRQDWVFEDTEIHDYQTDYTWTRTPVANTQGKWTQLVTQVDDSPRYEGTGTWVHIDGKSYWEAEAPAPLPRRELKLKRDRDYNVMVRNNRHEITDYGWVHDQDNRKVLKNEDGTEKTIALEKGWNTYTKVEDSHCQPSMDYWKKHQRFWAHVRDAWKEVMAEHDTFHLDWKNENGVIYMTMFQLAKESTEWSDKKIQREIGKTIKDHLVTKTEELGKL